MCIRDSFKTGPNGNTPKISLPAPSANLSRYPETQEDSYFTYNITIIKDGFRDKRFINVPVFEGQTSLQIVRMQPENGDYLKEEVVDMVESDDLQG